MKALFCCVLMLLVITGWALEYKTGSQRTVAEEVRDNTASFHTGSDDRHYYYSYPETEDHRWAVKYDFRSYFAGVDSALFAPDSVHIYLPSITQAGNLNAALYSDNIIEPGALIQQTSLASAELVIGWNTLNLSASADTVFWLVVDYQTGLINQQFVSASNNDGSHSYFWDPYYGEEGSWRNMSANGFNSEFLFTLEGEFILPVTDIEAAALYIEGELTPGAEVSVSAQIINNSSYSVENIELDFSKEFTGNNEYDTLYIEQMATDEILLTEPINYILNDVPGQYKFSLKVRQEDDEIDNDEIEIIKNVFGYERSLYLIENMVQLEDNYSLDIWQSQQNMESEALIINYFPLSVDEPYFSFEAQARYNYYDIYNMPATVVDGAAHIGHQSENYEEVVGELLQTSENAGSFVQFTSVEGLEDTLGNIHVNVTIDRGTHQLPAEFTAECKIKCLIIEEDLPLTDTENGIVFLDTLRFANEELDDLSNATPVVRQTSFNPLYKITAFHDSTDYCRLIFYIQDDSDKKIWAASSLAFTDFGIVSTEDNHLPPARRFYGYPNPFFAGDEINLSAGERALEIEGIKVFNLRGQCIRSIPKGSTVWNGCDDNGKLAASGIYFLQIKTLEQNSLLKIAFIR